MHITLQGVRLKVEGANNAENERATNSPDALASMAALAYRWNCVTQKGTPQSVETTGKLKLPNILVFSEARFLGDPEKHDAYGSDLMKRKLVAATGKSYAECRAALQRSLKSVPITVPLAAYAPLKPWVSYDIQAQIYHDAVKLTNATLGITAYVLIPSAATFQITIRHYCKIEEYGTYIDGHSTLLDETDYVEGYSVTKAGRQMRRRTLVERKKDSEAKLENAETEAERTRLRRFIDIMKRRITAIDEKDGAPPASGGSGD